MIASRIGKSISRKFMLTVLLTTSLALVLSAAVLLVLEIRSFQTASLNDLSTQADIIGQASVAAIEFDDSRTATQTLANLQTRPGIIAGALYDETGRRVAQFNRNSGNESLLPLQLASGGSAAAWDRITVIHDIVRNQRKIGSVYLKAEYALPARIGRMAAVLGATMLGSLLIAAIVSYWLQQAITAPIRALTDAVNRVTEKRDYSIRVGRTTADETGVLVDAFNEMLQELDERTRALEESNSALQQEMGDRIRAEAALRDLNNNLEERIFVRTNELNQAHEMLHQSQKLEAIGQLTGGVAHDFNNLLQVIAGNIQLLQPAVVGNPKAQDRLASAAAAAQRGAKLSGQLLAFARRQPLQPVTTNLGRIVRRMDDLLRRALGESIEIETLIAGGLWNTQVDPNQIENVILNLAINARDAMQHKGRLTIELGNAFLDDQYALSEPSIVPGQYVLLAVTDTGSGMSQDVLARAFDPFFTTKQEGQGTGLGLSMVHGFVKQSGGHVKIYSEPGEGTTVRIYLPRDGNEEAPIIPEPVVQTVGGCETILVVEDDAAVQNTTVDILAGLGYRVLKADNADSGLAILQSDIPIDLIFTDVVMPGQLKSPELAKRAKVLNPEIEVLFTSGYTQNAIVHGGRLDKGVELLSKPYSREQLARKIRQILDGKKLPGHSENHKEEQTTQSRPAIKSTKILLVEDNQDARDIASIYLGMIGHAVDEAESAELALSHLKEKQYDVLMTDIRLPGMSGIDLAYQAKILCPEIRIVFVSGLDISEQTHQMNGAVCLPKPYSLESLQKALAVQG